MNSDIIVACDLGGTKLSIAIVNRSLKILEQQELSVLDVPYEEQIEKMVNAVEVLVRQNPQVKAVGISIAGDVNVTTGTISYRMIDKRNDASNFEHTTIRIREKLEKASNRPVVIENDGNTATIAEWKAGAAQGKQNIVSLTIGTFLGSGVVLKGQLLERRESGVKIGALLVASKPFADVMPIGHYASGVGLRNIAEEILATRPSSQLKGLVEKASIDGKGLYKLAVEGDEDALAVYKEMGLWTGLAVTSTINMFQPEIVVLGGGVMTAHEFILPSALEIVDRYTEPGLPKSAEVVLAQHEHNSCLIGASIIAFDLLN